MANDNLESIVQQYDGLFLDNDGTCGKTEELHAQIGAQIIREAGVDITYEERLSFMGFGEVGIWDYLHAQGRTMAISKEEFKNLQAERFLAALNSLDDPQKLARPGIKRLAEAFHMAGKPVIVVSNTPRDVVLAVQKAVALQECVDHVISFDDMQEAGLKAKPAPDGYHWAQEIAKNMSGVNAGRYLAVEDADKGWKAADAAGCDTLLIYYQASGQKPNECATYNVADHLDVCEAFNTSALNVASVKPPAYIASPLTLSGPSHP